MFTAMLILGGLFAFVLGVVLLGLLVKLVLLPVRLGFVFLKLAVAGPVGVTFLIVGLPLVAVLLLPLALAVLVVWGTARFLFA
jgi:hypothetical protein